jgi:anti-sigma B factor antagonist
VHFHDFEIQEHEEDAGLRLILTGELDFGTAPVLEERLRRLAAEERTVRLDLSKLEFMDSTGIHVLLNALQTASGNGSRFEVIPEFSPQVARVLRLTHVDRLISGTPGDGTSS